MSVLGTTFFTNIDFGVLSNLLIWTQPVILKSYGYLKGIGEQVWVNIEERVREKVRIVSKALTV